MNLRRTWAFKHVGSAGEAMKNKIILKAMILLAICVAATAVHGETTAQHDQRMAWWREARFGMFIHWGPVSLTGQEISWSRANSNTNCPNNGPIPVAVYDNLYKRFDPTNFNADEWVRIAKNRRHEIHGAHRQTRRRFSALEFKGGRLQHRRDTISS